MQGLKAASSTLFSFTHRNKEAENARREAANTNSEPGQPGAAKVRTISRDIAQRMTQD